MPSHPRRPLTLAQGCDLLPHTTQVHRSCVRVRRRAGRAKCLGGHEGCCIGTAAGRKGQHSGPACLGTTSNACVKDVAIGPFHRQGHSLIVQVPLTTPPGRPARQINPRRRWSPRPGRRGIPWRLPACPAGGTRQWPSAGPPAPRALAVTSCLRRRPDRVAAHDVGPGQAARHAPARAPRLGAPHRPASTPARLVSRASPLGPRWPRETLLDTSGRVVTESPKVGAALPTEPHRPTIGPEFPTAPGGPRAPAASPRAAPGRLPTGPGPTAHSRG